MGELNTRPFPEFNFKRVDNKLLFMSLVRYKRKNVWYEMKVQSIFETSPEESNILDQEHLLTEYIIKFMVECYRTQIHAEARAEYYARDQINETQRLPKWK